MPRRLRTNKRRDLLTLERDNMLTLGPVPGESCPEPGSDEWERLRRCFAEHRDRYGPTTWGHLAFVVGDVQAALAANPLTPAGT